MIPPAKVLVAINLRYKSDVTELRRDCPFPEKRGLPARADLASLVSTRCPVDLFGHTSRQKYLIMCQIKRDFGEMT